MHDVHRCVAFLVKNGHKKGDRSKLLVGLSFFFIISAIL